MIGYMAISQKALKVSFPCFVYLLIRVRATLWCTLVEFEDRFAIFVGIILILIIEPRISPCQDGLLGGNHAN